MTWTGKYKLGAIAEARVGKYNIGTRAGKDKVSVRVSKHKLAARAGKYNLAARVSRYKLGARVRGQAKSWELANTKTLASLRV